MSEIEKLIEFYYGSLQAVRRAQKYYLAFLLTLLAFVWVCYWGKPEKVTSVNFLGMPVSETVLLGVAPGISTILLLGLIGCVRAVRPASPTPGRLADGRWRDSPRSRKHRQSPELGGLLGWSVVVTLRLHNLRIRDGGFDCFDACYRFDSSPEVQGLRGFLLC